MKRYGGLYNRLISFENLYWASRKARERLMLHPKKTIVAPISEGIDHLGYRIFPTHRRLRKDNIFRFVRKLKLLQTGYRAGNLSLKEIDASVQSWIGHSAHADTYNLRRSILERHPFKPILGNYSGHRNSSTA